MMSCHGTQRRKKSIRTYYEKIKLEKRTYYDLHRDLVLEKQKIYHKNHPEMLLKHSITHHEKYGNILGFPNWQKFKYALQSWSDVIQKLFNNKCQCCPNKAEIRHHILHKSKYPALSLNINNGIALCKKCHNEVHGWKLK